MSRGQKWLLLGLLLLGAKLALPFSGSDVSELVPVEALVVTREQGQVVVEGGACRGRGATWAAALQDLRQGADGRAFLSTAEQIVLCGAAKELLEDVIADAKLRPAACVCLCEGGTPAPERAAAFLRKKSDVTLRRLRAAQLRGEAVELPVLIQWEGGLRLERP